MPSFLSYATQTAVNEDTGTDYELSGKKFVGLGEVALIIQNFDGVYLHDLDFDGCLGCILLLNCTNYRIEGIRSRDTGGWIDDATTPGMIGSGKSNIIQLIDSRTGGGDNGIRDIIGFGGLTEDMISVYGDSGGVDVDNPLIIERVHLQSPIGDLAEAHEYLSGSGSGIMGADGVSPSPSFVVVQDSSALDAGQVLFQNYSGSGIIFRRNVGIQQGKLRTNACAYTPWTGGPYGGGAGIPVTDNEISENRFFIVGNLNGNRIFSGGTYYPDSSDTCIFDGGDSTPDPVTGLDPQTNILQDATLHPDDWSIDPITMEFAGGDAPPVGPIITLPSVPFHGTRLGGTNVFIRGTGFTDVTSVKFGGEDAEFTIDSDTQITAVTPAHTTGTVAIEVT